MSNFEEMKKEAERRRFLPSTRILGTVRLVSHNGKSELYAHENREKTGRKLEQYV